MRSVIIISISALAVLVTAAPGSRHYAWSRDGNTTALAPNITSPSPSTASPSPSTAFPSPSTASPSPSTAFPSPSTTAPAPGPPLSNNVTLASKHVTNQAALNWYNGDLTTGTKGVQPSNSYKCFSGNLKDYPTIDQWMNFEDMWTINKKVSIDGTKDTSEEETDLKSAIIQVSKESLLDARLILAAVIQESGGDLRTPCTAGYNCGILQGDHGSVSYQPGSSRSDSKSSILRMLRDGVEGTKNGLGYVQYINGVSYTKCTAGNPYSAARGYNTGECAKNGDMNCARYGTASYANDIANRLIGWDSSNSPEGKCHFPAVGCNK